MTQHAGHGLAEVTPGMVKDVLVAEGRGVLVAPVVRSVLRWVRDAYGVDVGPMGPVNLYDARTIPIAKAHPDETAKVAARRLVTEWTLAGKPR